jgi:hypothetical protein
VRKLLLFSVTCAIAASTYGQTAASAARTLSVRFGGHEVTVSGLTPGGGAILFGVGLQPTGQYTLTYRWSGSAEDTDNDGAVVMDTGREIPGPTIWCAADARTADFVVVTPGGRPFTATTLRPDAFRRRGNDVTQFAFDHPSLDLLYLEPGRGAWSCTESDGSVTDDDGPNGVTTLSIARCQPIGGGAGKAQAFHPGGVLVAIDMIRLEAIAMRLDGAVLGGAP